mgnify:CR=1 FL=1
MPLASFKFKAGINKENTDYSEEGGWVNANLIRFRKGVAEKVGGWIKAVENTFPPPEPVSSTTNSIAFAAALTRSL